MEITDQNLDMIELPSFVIKFQKLKQFEDKLFNFSEKDLKLFSNLSSFNKLFAEFNHLNIFDCKIKLKGVLERCDKISNKHIFINAKWKLEELYYLLRENHKEFNESLLKDLKKIYNAEFAINYSPFKRIEDKIKLNRKKIPNMDNLAQREFLRITTNSTKYFFDYWFDIQKDFQTGSNIMGVSFRTQLEVFLIKNSFHYLEFPYRSNCSYYRNSRTIFNSSSRDHCIRQCIRHNCEVHLKCSCFAIKNTVNQMDYGYKSLNICEANKSRTLDDVLEFEKKYTNICEKICPINCIQDDYILFVKEDRLFRDKYMKLILSWDGSKPFITNREVPVMSYTDYFNYVGGLFGMWFGISANQLFIKLQENYLNFYHRFINFSAIIMYTILEIIIFLKGNLQSMFSKVYNYFQITC
jgi:hypothetical protein